MDSKPLTVQEKITQLNNEVQEMHYKNKETGLTDVAFFHWTMPDKLQEIKRLILSVAGDNQELLRCLEPVCFTCLNNELSEVEKVSGRVNPQNGKEVDDEMRDLYLRYTKEYVDRAINSFISCCKKTNRSLLSQEVTNIGDTINPHSEE